MSRWMLSLMFVTAAAGTALAQPYNGQQRQQDRREIAQNNMQAADDANDLRQMQALIGRFDRARAMGNAAELQYVDNEVRRYVARELEEGRREQMQKNAEAQRSVNEARGSQRDVRNRPYSGRDRRDARDDRRDARDDVKDAQKEAAQNQRRYNVAVELNGIAGRLDPASLNRKRQLMIQLMHEAGYEYRETVKEGVEDRRELREDRRRR